MEEALTRKEYPAILDRLQPVAAAAKLNDRVKRIGRVNLEIADWIQERRKVEEAYAAGLRKLARRPLPLQETGGDLGTFDAPWKKIISAMDSLANSHTNFSHAIEKDVELPLRTFGSTNREMSGLSTTQGNLASMARDKEEAQDKADKLNKKGGKASAQKVEVANQKLQNANQLWDTQAPFIFESLQALDEARLNHLRDVLTQFETHEADKVEQNRIAIEQTLRSLLEVDTSQEIRAWSQAIVAGKPVVDRRTRQLSTAGSSTAGTSLQPPPQTPRSTTADNASERRSEQSGRLEPVGESKIKRIGTMFGRRRQSVHGGFARAPSPSKGFPSFSRNTASREGRPSPSPRASSNNLRESPSRDVRLSSLAESPSPTSPTSAANGVAAPGLISDTLQTKSSAPNGIPETHSPDLSGVLPPAGPPPSFLRKDSEGFTVPAPRDDPISQAQQEAAQEGDQPQFNVAIRNEPIPEQDADAEAALSNVANTLRSAQVATPSRKVGTVRGRRDVRNTIYMPSNSLDVTTSGQGLPPSPGIQMGRNAALAALSSGEHPAISPSDTTSIRSGHSTTSNALVKHADMHNPGLNASFIETVSATIEAGQVKTLKVSGEIALIYNKAESDEFPPATETIRINNFPNLEAIGPNRTFIQRVSEEKPEEYTISIPSISFTSPAKPVAAFTYRGHVDEANLTSQAPLLIRLSWKTQDDKLGLILEYCLNPAYSTAAELFHDLVFVAHHTGPKSIACKSKPGATHFKDLSKAAWRLGNVSLTNEWKRLICRFIGTEGQAPEPSSVEVKWELHGSASLRLGSGIGISKLEAGKGTEKEEGTDPFADESISSPTTATTPGNWVEVETSKKFISAGYEAREGPQVQAQGQAAAQPEAQE